MLGKITLMIVGFVSFATAQEDTLFSLFKKHQKPEIKVPFKPIKVGGDLDKWRDQTNRQFNKCDSNNSGYISKFEYSRCNPYDNNWDQLVAQFDSNRDNLLSWNEVFEVVKYNNQHTVALADLQEDELDNQLASMTFLWENLQNKDDTGLISLITAQDKVKLDQLMQFADLNRDGSLSKDEIRILAKNMGGNLDEAKLNMVWTMIDTNRDSLLQYQEIVSAIDKFGTNAPMSMITAQDEAQLKQIFPMVDANKDGKISKEEVKNFAVMMGGTVKDEELNMIWALVDSNRDNLISYDEIIVAANTYGSGSVPQSLLDQTLISKVNFVFATYDHNKNGFLDLAEFKNLLKSGFPTITDAQTRMILSSYDKNFDGKLSWNEVFQAAQMQRQH